MSKDLIVVKRCSSALESSFVKAFLENNGIKAWDSGEEQRAWTGRYSMIARGARIMVLPGDAARARALLEHPPEFHAQEEDAEDAEGPGGAGGMEFDEAGDLMRCPNCGSEKIEELASSPVVRWLTVVMLLGLPLLFGRKRVWICRACDWDSTRE